MYNHLKMNKRFFHGSVWEKIQVRKRCGKISKRKRPLGECSALKRAENRPSERTDRFKWWNRWLAYLHEGVNSVNKTRRKQTQIHCLSALRWWCYTGQFLTTIVNAIWLHKKSIRVTWRLQVIFNATFVAATCYKTLKRLQILTKLR